MGLGNAQFSALPLDGQFLGRRMGRLLHWDVAVKVPNAPHQPYRVSPKAASLMPKWWAIS